MGRMNTVQKCLGLFLAYSKRREKKKREEKNIFTSMTADFYSVLLVDIREQ